MPNTREYDLAEEVALIQSKLHHMHLSDTASDASAHSGEDEKRAANASSSRFPSTTGSRFDILLHDGAGDSEGLCCKQLMRKVMRQTHSTCERNDAIERRYGQSLATKDRKRLVQQPFSHLLVCDFEATCDAASPNYPHEIIEFPVICVDTAKLCVVAEFHSYVRPTRNPHLTSFCHTLTGITQEQVDAAPTLPEVLRLFDIWLRTEVYPRCLTWREEHRTGLSHNLRSQQRHFVYDESDGAARTECEQMVCMVTDGPWDMRKFMYECSVLRDGHCFPPLFYRWVNLRHCFAEHFRTRPRKLTDMLKKLGLTFHGHHHSGIDDSRNIARVLVELLARGHRVSRVSTVKYGASRESHVAAATAQLLEEFGDDDADLNPLRRRGNGMKSRHKKSVGSVKRDNRRR